jgi:UDP-glucose 4-epimerase
VEHYLDLFAGQFGLPYTVLRYANIFGPRQNAHGEAGVIAIFAGQLLNGIRPHIFGDGTKTRDYLFIEDVVRANLHVLDQGENTIYNLGSGVETSDREVCGAVAAAVGVAVDPIYEAERVGEVRRIALDASRARAGLGWQPQVAFAEGVRRAVEYYRRVEAARQAARCEALAGGVVGHGSCSEVGASTVPQERRR